jgi:hypothetical protein
MILDLVGLNLLSVVLMKNVGIKLIVMINYTKCIKNGTREMEIYLFLKANQY